MALPTYAVTKDFRSDQEVRDQNSQKDTKPESTPPKTAKGSGSVWTSPAWSETQSEPLPDQMTCPRLVATISQNATNLVRDLSTDRASLVVAEHFSD